MQTELPTEDQDSVFQYVDKSVIQCHDFLGLIKIKSPKATKKAHDNIPLLIFTYIIHIELKNIKNMFDLLDLIPNKNIQLGYLPMCPCIKFDNDEDIQINSIIDLKIFIVHIMYNIILEFVEFMKILYMDNYDVHISEENNIVSIKNMANNLLTILTFLEHDIEGFEDIDIEKFMQCMESNTKSKSEICLVFEKMVNVIYSLNNLQEFIHNIIIEQNRSIFIRTLLSNSTE